MGHLDCYKMPKPSADSSANNKNSTPPTRCTAFSEMYLLARAPAVTAMNVATACPKVAPVKTPMGLDLTASAIVASIERSPHSAINIKDITSQNALRVVFP